MKQKAQINPGLSLSLDEKRGHVNGQSSERGRHLLDQLELQLERDGTDRFDPGRSEPDRIRRELPLRRRRAEVRVILDMMREAKGPVTRGQRFAARFDGQVPSAQLWGIRGRDADESAHAMGCRSYR